MTIAKEWKKLQVSHSRAFINPTISDLRFANVFTHENEYEYKITVERGKMRLIIDFRKKKKKLFG